jgi:hypothetical protein
MAYFILEIHFRATMISIGTHIAMLIIPKTAFSLSVNRSLKKMMKIVAGIQRIRRDNDNPNRLSGRQRWILGHWGCT